MTNANETSPATASAHTPGPWVLLANGQIKAQASLGRWDDYVCEMPFTSLAEAAELGPHLLPNARLIAAAPELLAACGELHDFLSSLVEGGVLPPGRTRSNATDVLTRHLGVFAEATGRAA